MWVILKKLCLNVPFERSVVPSERFKQDLCHNPLCRNEYFANNLWNSWKLRAGSIRIAVEGKINQRTVLTILTILTTLT